MEYEQNIMTEGFRIFCWIVEGRSCSQLKPNESPLPTVRKSIEVLILNSFYPCCEVSPLFSTTVHAILSMDHDFDLYRSHFSKLLRRSLTPHTQPHHSRCPSVSAHCLHPLLLQRSPAAISVPPLDPDHSPTQYLH